MCIRDRAAPAIRGFAGSNPAAFGCIRDALIGSALELGTVAATDQTFSAGRLAGTAGVDCAVGAAFGAFRATNAFDQLGFGGRRATTFLEGFTAVGGSDTLVGDGFSFDRAVGAGIAGAALDGIAEVVAGRLVAAGGAQGSASVPVARSADLPLSTNTVRGTTDNFSVAGRVADQLTASRLGTLAGRFDADDLQGLLENPNARAFFDTNTQNINVLQEIDGILFRITTASDEFRIISVGRLRQNQLVNGISNGRFLPIVGV